MQHDAFSYPAPDQLINHVGAAGEPAGKRPFRSIRTPYGGSVRAPRFTTTRLMYCPYARKRWDPVDAC